MKTNILCYAVVAVIASVSTCAYTQNTYGGAEITALGTLPMEYDWHRVYIGDETTTEIYLPNIVSIGENVRLNTPNVRSIELGSSIRRDKIYLYAWGTFMFDTYEGGSFYDDIDMSRLTEFVMYQPGWCEYPMDSWWHYPAQLTFVPYGIGSSCPKIERVILPTRAQCILYSFDGCAKLPTVTLPECAGYIGCSFNNCESIRDIRVRSGYVTGIEESFGNLPGDAVIYVPKGFKETYENSAWGELGCTIADGLAAGDISPNVVRCCVIWTR